jgi:hypothetical protein
LAVLAYVFWHMSDGSVGPAEYEARLAAFHERLAADPPIGFAGSIAVRVGPVPWFAGGGYEDWYLVEDWTALGALNAAAVDASRLASHSAVASHAGDGAGGVYRLVDGGLALADAGEATWSAARPPVEGSGFALWQRQMVLGPAPEFCLLTRGPERRAAVAGGLIGP